MTGRADRRSAVAACAAVGVLVFGLATVAHAHGGGGGHAGPRAVGGGATVDIAGYEVTLLSDPAPLTAGREGRIVARVATAGSRIPVTGGAVEIGAGVNGDAHGLVPAPEVTWAGSYTTSFVPARGGPHHVRVVIASLEGRRFEPPLEVGFQLEVGRAGRLGWPAWSAMALAVALGGAAVYGTALRGRHAGPVDLLAIPFVRTLLTSAPLQTTVQLLALALTGIIVVLGFVDVQDGGVNLATRLTWTLWWPGVIFTFVLAGRVWCVACPFGALNEWSARASGASRRLPRMLRNVWWATAAFVLLTWADEQLGVVRSPAVTAWLVLGMAALAVGTGLRYERRSFCRHLCPIGGLIGIYSMIAPVALRAADGRRCTLHAEKTCVRGSATNRGCPMFEFPQTLDRNNYCTLCGDCVRGCDRGNLVLRLRAFGTDLWATGRRALDEAYLAVALVGLTLLVTAAMLTAWPEWISALARWLPPVVRTSLRPVTYLGLVETLVLLVGSLVVVPAVVFAGGALSVRLAARADAERATTPRGSRRSDAARAFVRFGYMFVPVGLAMHLAHNLAHLLLEGGGLLPAVQRAVLRYTPFVIGEPDWRIAPLVAEPVVAWLQLGVLLGFFVVSLVVGHRLALASTDDARAASRALLPYAALSLAFTVLGIVLLAQPMGMRHGM